MKVRKIRTQCCGLLFSGTCLQRDNTQPHTACHTFKQIQKLEMLPHLLYSPNLISSYCHPFQPQIDPLHGHHFTSVEEVKVTVIDWLAQQPKDFFYRGIYASVERSRWCAEHGRDYVED
jgi:hypothetical protein